MVYVAHLRSTLFLLWFGLGLALNALTARKGYPLDVQAYVEEPRFVCSKDDGCPVLEHSWGQVLVKDPHNGHSATFRDVMAGPGWAKEWNWGHHDPHVTHNNGPTDKEVEEVLAEMKEHDAGALSLSSFFMSRGVNGELADNQAADSKVMALWSLTPVVEKSEALVVQFNEAMKAGNRAAILLHSTC
eukprot:TRINITY_DN27383_c0_g1_i1.p1 TRINITY_DN27383_c0_g1~~TRINITY_DN27383_c0_g1_i1.p1  ORF type:complete len:187 (-),score=37.19 TRINITY_DN27383_c0_g1_i1:13-573(-)